MRVIITGGAGFIGSHITDLLLKNQHEILIVDNLSTGKVERIPKGVGLKVADVRNYDEIKNVFCEFKPEVIYHLAAQIDVQTSINDAAADATTNIVGGINVLNAAVAAGAKKVIYASSAAVYGEPEYLGIDEKHAVCPMSPYGITKHTLEHYLAIYRDMYGLDYTVLRFANVYGPRQEAKGEGGVVSVFTERLLKNIEARIFGDGTFTRDFVCVYDIAQANYLALTRGSGEIFNIGTGIPTSVNELYAVIKEACNSSLDPIYAPMRKGDIPHSYFDISKAREILGYEPKYSLKEGLKATVEECRSRI